MKRTLAKRRRNLSDISGLSALRLRSSSRPSVTIAYVPLLSDLEMSDKQLRTALCERLTLVERGRCELFWCYARPRQLSRWPPQHPLRSRAQRRAGRRVVAEVPAVIQHR
jgi:hypothetical protein